ncbi:cytochrome P450 4C1-like isoform X1 [Polistes fuscatus]|uniref:cytochrome P450 4C1-like isoform X1 n=1 Tax=Polistes fuscatus TaxID=30207 RepID=UPI001CA9D63A|nr:cytochrome P450 4C1-like isoform X1 [Polistes fuscatus]
MILLFYLIKYISDKFREHKLVKKCSGPKPYPLIGNLNVLLGDMKDITHKIIKLSTIYSSPWLLWVGPKLVVILDDPENIEILSKSSSGYEKSSLYFPMKNALGDGLFTAPASIWDIHRTILNPVFKEVSTYMDSMIKNSNRLANILETTNGKNVDIMHYVHLCTLDIIYDSLLESDLNLQSNPDCKLDEYISEAMDIAATRIVKFWLHPNIIFNNSSMGKRLQEILSPLNKITNEIIRKKKNSMNEDNFTREGKDPHAKKDTSPFLDAIFKSFYETRKYSEADIRDEINTMVFAGSDTAANSLTFLFLMLATFPDIQNQVYEELYDMYDSSDPIDVPITMEDTKKMKYLERVIKETLRLFPPALLIGRTLKRDTKGNDYVILPKNCQVFFMIFTLHRKEKYWADPLRFNPDRFLPGKYNSKCFIPFSTGRRGCIGQIFAMTKMKAIAATVLRKFIIQIDEPIPVANVNLKLSVTTKPAETIFLRFKKR